MIPRTLLYVYLGSLAEASLTDRGRTWQEWTWLAVGLAASLGLMITLARLAVQRLRETAPPETRGMYKGPTFPARGPGKRLWIALAMAGLALASLSAAGAVSRLITTHLAAPADEMQEEYESPHTAAVK